MNINDKRKLERDKYENIYLDVDNHYKNHNDLRGYGRGNHGKNIIPFIQRLNPTSLLDIGCGYGNFCDEMQKSGVENVYGMDIASVKTGNIIKNDQIKFIHGEAHSLPFEDNSIDIITSFDVLEHCLRDDIDIIFSEINRVVKYKTIFSIAYKQSGENTKGVILHMTVEPESWWIEKLKKYFFIEKNNKYLICTKNNTIYLRNK